MRSSWPVILTLAALAGAPGASQNQERHVRLFPPENLGLLESPDRDEWQQPEWIMDQLLIADGSRVADIGAGGGWFTIRLAHRVGPNGRVFAEDIQPQMLESIARRVRREGLSNVVPVLGAADDPRLEDSLDAVLIVDVYPQLADPVTFLRNIRRSLAPNGRLGIVDFKTDGAGGPGPPLDERVSPQEISRDAYEAGLRQIAYEEHLPYQYLFVFGR